MMAWRCDRHHQGRGRDDRQQVAEARCGAGGEQRDGAVCDRTQAGRCRHDQQSDMHGTGMADSFAGKTGDQAKQRRGQGDDGHRHAGTAQRQAELGLQQGHQRRQQAELARGDHPDGIEKRDAAPGRGHGGRLCSRRAAAHE